MKAVQRLPEALANQIAAGEVVERPASAVKELVENALDAGAGRISVEVEDGGRQLVRVTDDGRGMSREDALLALERHTTSKLTCAEDLFALSTFGFRGEALPSIASVSRFTLTTRRAEDLAATCIVVEGGKVLSVEETGAPVGTRIEVADLFFNVPARLKFLKTRATELGHVTDWLTRLGLANPHVGISLTEGSRTHLKAEATTELRERIAALLGREVYDALYPVEETRGNVTIRGFAAGPQRANANAREIFTFVNRRFVRDRGLMHAIARGYDGVLPIGRSPACVLFLEVAPDKVDVNVHPQKLEVRFSEGRSVYDVVARSVAATLAPSPWLSRAPAKTYRLEPRVESQPPAEEPSREVSSPTPQAGLTPLQQRIADAMGKYAERRLDDPENLQAADPGARWTRPSAPAPTRSFDLFAPRETAQPQPTQPSGSPPTTALRFSDLRYLGQVHGTYLVCESPQGVLLLDQHAAHERVLYERFRADRKGSRAGQPLLVPVTMELSPADARLVEAALEDLAGLGFEIEPFGGTTFAVKSAPDALKGSALSEAVLELATQLREHGRGAALDVAEEALLARMACHSAVRAHDPLSPEEAKDLLRQLDGTPFHAQCPHGRPVAVLFDADRLKEMFGRTYEGTPKAAARERMVR